MGVIGDLKDSKVKSIGRVADSRAELQVRSGDLRTMGLQVPGRTAGGGGGGRRCDIGGL